MFFAEAKVGKPLWEDVPENIPRELSYFKDTRRIGILATCAEKAIYDRVIRYKKELEVLGYEVEVLFYIDAKEIPGYMLGSYISHADLDKNLIPFTPKPDRFIKKKFDLLLNLYFEDYFPVQYIAKKSHAKCRVGAYRQHIKDCSDLFVYTDEENDLEQLITQIDNTLQKQAYERKVY